MTAFALSFSPSSDYPYALFSPEARLAQSQIVISAPPPSSPLPTIVRTIELRQQPFARVSQKMEAFASLVDGWDSYGAAPISAVALTTARAIIRDLSFRAAPFGAQNLVPFSVSPVPTGGINIEWRKGDDAIELWIESDGEIALLIDRPRMERRFVERRLGGIPAAIHEVLTFAG